MELGYNSRKSLFYLKVPAGQDAYSIVKEQGWDFSTSASSVNEAVLMNASPYAALPFVEHANWDALGQLAGYQTAYEDSWRKESNAHITVPDGEELWPFQRAGVEFACRRDHVLIGDQPGLGKTPMAVATANETRAKSILVVCPANIRLQWQAQIRRWSTLPGRYLVYPILKSKDGVHPTAEWTIISYDLLRNAAIHEALMQRRYDLLVLDEAHYLKSPSRKRTQAVFSADGLGDQADKILALTGTPLPNRPRECYTLAKGLDFSSIDWMGEGEFMRRFNPSKQIAGKKKVGDKMVDRVFYKEMTGRLPELHARLRCNFMIRRMKRDVLDQLPPVQHEIVYVEETGEIRKALQAEAMLEIDPTHLDGTADILGEISTVRRMMGVAMAPQAAEYVEGVLEGGEEKVFVVGWHTQVLDILEARLQKYGLVRVDGGTSPVMRQKNVESFCSDPGTRIFLGNILAVGIGTDGLQKACSRLIGAECDWVPGNNQQVVDRLDRIGQESSVLASWLVAPKSFGERILQTSLKKLQNIHETLDKEIY